MEQLEKKVRVAVFASHYHGAAVIESLISLAWPEVVIVATDDPLHPSSNAKRRIWRYGFDEDLRFLTRRKCRAAGIEPYTESIKDSAFVERFHAARPTAIIGATFGQKIPAEMLAAVSGVAYNLHPTVPGLPLEETRGARAFEKARERGNVFEIAIHRMTEKIDDGEVLARSEPFFYPSEMTSLGETFSDGAVFVQVLRDSSRLSASVIEKRLESILRTDLGI